MTPLVDLDDRRKFLGWIGALAMLCLLSFGMSELLTGCATVNKGPCQIHPELCQ